MRILTFVLGLAFSQVSFAHETCKTDWFEAIVAQDSIMITHSTFSQLNDAATALGLTFPLRFDRQEYVCHIGEGPNYCESGMSDNGRIFLELTGANSQKVFSQLFKCK